MKMSRYFLLKLYGVTIGCLLLLSVGCEDVDDEDELVADPSLVGTWMEGDIFIVTGWPEALDTVDILIPLDSYRTAEFSTDGIFEFRRWSISIPEPVVTGTGTWATSENWLYLTYSDRVDTVGYTINNSDLGLIYHYPVGDEHHQFEHWKIDHYTK